MVSIFFQGKPEGHFKAAIRTVHDQVPDTDAYIRALVVELAFWQGQYR